MPLPDTKDTVFRGSCFGWLITIGLDDTIRMLNPFTKAQIHLPPISALPSVISFDPERHDEEYTLTGDFEGLYTYEKWVMQLRIHKIFLSCPPDDKNQDFMAVAIAVIEDLIHMCYCRRGDKRWTTQQTTYYEDVIFCEGKICAVDGRGFIYEFDMKTTLGGISREPYFDNKVRTYIDDSSYLVQSNGSLLLVVRQGKQLAEFHDENEGNEALGLWFLNRRAPREAGFTEQRKPPAHDSGGITGCGSPSPLCHLSLAT
ncbi:putative F-box protein [Senna tora]|uniref:Putative F-box protein n=1 Tax=Senna tora TaxID=362788 RepID=A0A834STI2_9FABA|nr:putative F-box protein [Senna tora]